MREQLEALIQAWRSWDSHCTGCRGRKYLAECEVCSVAVAQMHLASDQLAALLAVPVPHQEPSEDFADVVNWLRATVRDDIGPFTTAFSRRLSQAADVLARRAVPTGEGLRAAVQRLRDLGTDLNRGAHVANLAEQIWDECDAIMHSQDTGYVDRSSGADDVHSGTAGCPPRQAG
jgi:hypothetical protein